VLAYVRPVSNTLRPSPSIRHRTPSLNSIRLRSSHQLLGTKRRRLGDPRARRGVDPLDDAASRRRSLLPRPNELGPATGAAGTDIILARRALAEAGVDTTRRFSLAVFFDLVEALAGLAFLPTDERRCARNMVDCSEPETRFAAAYCLVACGRRPGVRCSWAVTVRRAPTWLAISAEEDESQRAGPNGRV
jgi:hypothetical protein